MYASTLLNEGILRGIYKIKNYKIKRFEKCKIIFLLILKFSVSLTRQLVISEKHHLTSIIEYLLFEENSQS